jgi:aarF domain-containing kinase
LLKVYRPEGNQLGYLDFGILSTIPSQVRDGLVCAVSYLIFARDIESVASLFGELQLLPHEVMENPVERAALTAAMELTLNEALVYETNLDDTATQIPVLKFDQLLSSLTRLVPRFRFQLPPYFINNARALSTLEGIARSLDPRFNVFQVMYPLALTKLITNPTNSKIVDKTLQDLIRDPVSRRVDPNKLFKILNDSALITGYSRLRVIYDILKTRGGRKFMRRILSLELFSEIWMDLQAKKRQQNRNRRKFLRL